MAESAGDLYVTAKVDASNLAVDLARQTESKAEDSGVTIGGLVGKGLKIGATAAAGGIAAVLTGAFIKGFGRLTSIDQAKAKLEGLGITGNDLKEVMDNALKSVQGTAYGLDEAVSPIPGLLAAGIKPGEQLTQALTNIGSAATLSGSSFGDLSSVFGDAAASSGSLNEVFNRLEDRGIPALQMVADHMGLTREEAKKLSSEGGISFQQFNDAMTASIGPAALAAGGSFQGMLANIMTGLGKLGALVLGPAFEGMKTVMPSVLEALAAFKDALTPIMEEIAPRVAEAFANIKSAIDNVDWGAVAATVADVWGNLVEIFDSVSGAVQGVVDTLQPGLTSAVGEMGDALTAIPWDSIVDGITSTFGWLADHGDVVIAVIAGIGGAMLASMVPALISAISLLPTVIGLFWLWAAALLANPITWIVLGIGLLIAALVLLFLNWDKVVKWVTDVWGGFMDWLKGVMDGFLGWWGDIWDSITGFVKDVIDNVIAWVQDNWGLLLSFLIGPIGLAIQWIVEHWGEIAQFFVDVWNNIVAFLQPAIDVIANIFRVLGETLANIWLVIRAVFVVAWEAIVAFVTPIINALVSFFTTIFTEFGNFWRDVWAGISHDFTVIWEAIVAFITPIIDALVSFITDNITAIQEAWETIWEAIGSFFEDTWNNLIAFLLPIIASVVQAIQGPLNTIKGIWEGIWNSVKQFFTDAWNAIVSAVKEKVDAVVTTVTGIKDKVMGAVTGALDWLKQVGKDIIQGMINGITSMVNKVKTAITDTVGGVIDWAKGILGEHSPSKVFDKIGVDLGRGFVNGIDSMATDVQAAVGQMTLGAVDVAGSTITTMPASASGTGATTTNSQFTIEPGAIQIVGDDPYKTSLLVVDRIAEKVAI